MTSIPSGITQLDWPIKVGQDRPVTFELPDEFDTGAITVVGGSAGAVEAAVTPVEGGVEVLWPLADLASLLLHPWELLHAGVTVLQGTVTRARPSDPGGLEHVTVSLANTSVQVTAVVGAGAGLTQATYTIPLVGQWNPPIITETGTGLTQNVFLIGCPVLPSFHPELELAAIEPPPSMPFMVEVAAPTTPPVDPPALPTVDDIPPAWTPIPGQEIEAADIYGILLYPLDYVALENQGVAMWIRGRSVDADGYETLIYLWFPNGIGPGITDVDVVMFAQGERFEHTVPAAADETTPGDPIDMTVVYRPTGSGAAAAAQNVDARIDSLAARIAALEA